MHVPDARALARRLPSLAPLVVVSVPHRRREGSVKNHVHDPVTGEKLADWMGREPNHSFVVHEPFQGAKDARPVAVYHEDPERRFGTPEVRERRVRTGVGRTRARCGPVRALLGAAATRLRRTSP